MHDVCAITFKTLKRGDYDLLNQKPYLRLLK